MERLKNIARNTSPVRFFLRNRNGDICLGECGDMLNRARMAFQDGRTTSEKFRLAQLDALIRLVFEHESDLADALGRDLHKPRFETVVSELILVKNEALYAVKNLHKWMEPQHVDRNLSTALDACMVVNEPLGTVLILGSWSSPVQLCLVPLVGAIAAGNCAIIVPSEHCTYTAELLHRLLPSYLDNECYHIALATEKESIEIVDLKFDHVFFSGCREEGTKVCQAAARHLTPVTLILSGKNPCYVDRECDINITARRIAWARFHNSGQNTASPDYVLCHAQVKEPLLWALRDALVEFYGSDARESESYGRLVSMENFTRVRDLLWRSGKVLIGGQVNEAERFVAPTILTDVSERDPVMRHEYSGPILPVLTVENVDEAISFINNRDKPLCVYVYSSSTKVISRLMKETTSGSFCSNDSVLQSLMPCLPFGGVGQSGMGSYHGRYSFDTFSHKKSCLLRATRVECLTYLRYPPYDDRNLSLMTWASTLTQKSQGWCHIL
ncbi:aldehyde dehydrogenase family 3 member B1-like [Engraulis encrasicolus]|uniref:aldehyde dehydrogenase family 3 member B1-like n=1 Tax=Engraulis encrasicolus TaxID=184585 RepID=UPI002FCF6AD0